MYNYGLPSWPLLSGTDDKLKFDGTNAYAYAKRGQVSLKRKKHGSRRRQRESSVALCVCFFLTLDVLPHSPGGSG